MSIIAVTPTGDRPDTLELCAYYVGRQSVRPAMWLVIDDGEKPCNANGAEIIRREPQPDDPCHTLCLNMQLAMSMVDPDDKIIVFEDDDWYGPNYLATISDYLDEFDLAGQCGTYYYYYPDALLWGMGNLGHCSLYQTGFRARIMQTMVYPDNFSLDLALWKIDCRKCILPGNPPLAIGMKGLPGRRGQSAGHDKNRKQYKKDHGREWLRKTIGTDAKLYERFL